MTQEKQPCFCDFCLIKRANLRSYNVFLGYGADKKQIEKMTKEDEKRLICIKNRPGVRLRLSPSSVYAQTKRSVNE